jgi:hypothetical protein
MGALTPLTASAPEAGRSPVLSCAIMAHPSRRRSAERIATRLAALSPTIAYDPEPDVRGSTLPAALAAWSAVAAGATHHLVVQDDIEPVDDFVPRLLRAVAAHPDKVLCAFTEWGCLSSTMVRWAALSGAGFAECVDSYVPTQATVLPAADAAAFVAYARRNLSTDTPDDIGLRRFLAVRGRSAYALAPNLVDHDTASSIVGNMHHGPRSAAWLPAGDDPPPRDGIVCAPPRIPTQTYSKARSLCVGYAPEVLAADDWEPTRRVLARRGADRRRIAELLDAELDLAGPAVDLELLFGYPMLHELWVTAIALGALLPAAPGAAPAVDHTVVRALRTMAPGGMRCFVDAGVLRKSDPALSELVVKGVSFGLGLREGS